MQATTGCSLGDGALSCALVDVRGCCTLLRIDGLCQLRLLAWLVVQQFAQQYEKQFVQEFERQFAQQFPLRSCSADRMHAFDPDVASSILNQLAQHTTEAQIWLLPYQRSTYWENLILKSLTHTLSPTRKRVSLRLFNDASCCFNCLLSTREFASG